MRISLQNLFRRRTGVFLAVLLVVVVVVRIAIFFAVQAAEPARIIGEDTESYLSPAKALFVGGAFTSSPQPQSPPETIRTPGYPAFIASLFFLFGPTLRPVIIAQIIFSAATLLFASLIANSLWGHRAALASALLLALDPISLLASQMVLSDSLFTSLLTAALWAGFRALHGPEARPRWLLLFGSLLALATLVRPISYYLIGPVLLVVVLSGLTAGRPWRSLVAIIFAIALPWAVLVGGWQLRNFLTAGSAEFSHIRGINLLLYRGAAIVSARDGISFEEARELLERSLGTRDGETTAARCDRYAREGAALIAHHPLLFLRDQLRGLARMLAVPGEGDLLKYLGIAIPATGPAGDLLRLEGREFLRRWIAGHLALLLVFSLTLAYLLFVYACAARAVASLAAADRSAVYCHLLLVGTAVYLLVVSAGPEAYARFRIPLMPILAIYAGGFLAVFFRPSAESRKLDETA